jgi:hypothetical protein
MNFLFLPFHPEEKFTALASGGLRSYIMPSEMTNRGGTEELPEGLAPMPFGLRIAD